MKKFQYMIVTVSHELGFEEEKMRLKLAGDKGFELISALPRHIKGKMYVVFYLKREV